ncbi:MAG: hypothetical protein ABFS23_00920 [Pseudomonadota bacterium]
MKGNASAGGLPDLHLVPQSTAPWKRFVVMVHALAAAGLVFAAIPWAARLAGAALIGMSLVREYRDGFPVMGGTGLRAAHLDTHDEWLLETASGRMPARLLAGSRVWQGLIYLRFDAEGSRYWLLLLAGGMPKDELRRLRSRLLPLLRG